MKFLIILIFFIPFTVHAENVCIYNCPSLSVGYVNTYGNVNTLLDDGTHLTISFTPKYAIEKLNKKIEETKIIFLSKLKFSFSADWYHFTGPKLNRKADFITPVVHLNFIKELFSGQINSSIAYGYGYLNASRTGYESNGSSSLVLLNSLYERSVSFGILGIGIELGSIANSNYPIHHYGLLAKYGYQF